MGLLIVLPLTFPDDDVIRYAAVAYTRHWSKLLIVGRPRRGGQAHCQYTRVQHSSSAVQLLSTCISIWGIERNCEGHGRAADAGSGDAGGRNP